MAGRWGEWLADLADLVLPAGCAGCTRDGVRLVRGLCPACVTELRALSPGPVRPSPAPAGAPSTSALGGYEGALRAALLAYKEQGRHRLGAPLGALLAEVVAAAVTLPRGPAARPVLLVPVPSTARAARARHGDHLLRLARHAAWRLRRAGHPTLLVRPLRARPRADSAGLGGAARAEAAAHAFAPRALGLPAARWRAAGAAAVVVVDDVVTTGATLAAVSRALAGAGIQVTAAAVLAATRRRRPVRAAAAARRTRPDT